MQVLLDIPDMEEQVHEATPDEEAVIEERLHKLDDDENLEDIDSLLDDL